MNDRALKEFDRSISAVLVPFLETKGFRQVPLEPGEFLDAKIYDFMKVSNFDKRLLCIQMEAKGRKLFRVLIAQVGLEDTFHNRAKGQIPITRVRHTAKPDAVSVRARIKPHVKWNPLGWIYFGDWFAFKEPNPKDVLLRVIRLFPQMEQWWESPKDGRIYMSHVYNGDIIPPWIRKREKRKASD